MKQIISAKQLEELSDSAYEKYLDWMIKRDYNQGFGRDHIVPMNIGQLIEFLDDKEYFNTHLNNKPYKSYAWQPKDILCDALWEAVKEVLNGKSN